MTPSEGAVSKSKGSDHHSIRPQQVRQGVQLQHLFPRMPLPSVNPLELLERMSQNIGARVRPDHRVQRPVWFRAKPERLPLLGLRSQRQPVEGRLQGRGEIYRGRDALFSPLRTTRGTRSICQIRSERRQHLFKLGIAGKGRRFSPGQGGTYKRKADSYYSCTKVRK